jgi:hypothetical protein
MTVPTTCFNFNTINGGVRKELKTASQGRMSMTANSRALSSPFDPRFANFDSIVYNCSSSGANGGKKKLTNRVTPKTYVFLHTLINYFI